MKKCALKLLAGGLIVGSLCSCTTSNSTVGAVAGTGVGALAGGLIGHGNPAGIAVGAIAGGVGGYFIGKNTEKNKSSSSNTKSKTNN